jgi:DNA-binding transcriptional MocR family regulator
MGRAAEVEWTPPRLERGSGPKYLAIADAIADAVADGALRPGDRLPPQRELARRLDVDLTTVTRAFGEARRRGLLDAHVGRGSFVRARPGASPAAPAAPLADLSMNMPPQPASLRLGTRIAADMAAIMSAPGALAGLHYQDGAGIALHREAAAFWLSRRFGPLAADRVLIASGAQSALSMIVDQSAGRGDRICAGELTYPGLKAAAEHRGLSVEPLAMDGQGIDPDAFEAACRRAPPKLLYLVPTIDNPTTATLPLERRRAIAATAARHGVRIVEDDAYGALAAAPPPPIASIAPEVGWYIASLSKCATPALRIAYVVTPGPAQTAALAAGVRATSLMAPPLMSALAARWADEGTLDAMAAAIRHENVARQALAGRMLGEAAAAQPEGHHLWLRLPPHWPRGQFVAQALAAGLSVVPSDAFATGSRAPDAVRVSIGVAADREELERALQRLSRLLDRRATSALVV